MNNDKVNKKEAFQFGGTTSAFTRFNKLGKVQEQPQIDIITNTRSNRKTAFARIKQLFSLQT
jgi:hypothetical protein